MNRTDAIAPWSLHDHGDNVFVVAFDDEQAGLVEAGMRKQIIVRGSAVAPGDALYLVRDRGSSHCRRLRSTQAETTQRVFIDSNKSVLLDGRVLTHEQSEQFARCDGFDSLDVFISYYRRTHALPIDGQLVRWM